MKYIIFVPFGMVIIAMVLDVIGYFGPSDSAMEHYYDLKNQDENKAKEFLKSVYKW